jgi:hypothetical protein
MKFHSAFERSVARVLYKADWGVAKPIIMKRHGWKRCSSEVLISTPRRFGKTFSWVASLPLRARPRAHPRARPPQHRHLHGVPRAHAKVRDCHLQCVAHGTKALVGVRGQRPACTGPARRASRKLLERIIE